jgi:1-deoxy-D-xylulose-5-phosphate reductoisomerase
MGGKVTIDSATLMNKGLEVIEAHWLFDVPYEQIEVLIHPESIIHSLVEFADGSQVAQLSLPDMRLPIQYALTYPRHRPGPCRPLSLADIGGLHFAPPDEARFPALRLAREAGVAGGSHPTALSAADEVAVDAFLSGRIGFGAIAEVVERALERHRPVPIGDVEAILEVDAATRADASDLVESAALQGRRFVSPRGKR